MGSENGRIYDYIICGGGTAGCALAGRLAEDPSVSILLVEAGGPRDSVPASNIPAAVAQILGSEADWNIQSEPCSKLNDRQLHLGRGKFIGGSSGCNGTLTIRGSRQDYDDWKMDGWSGDEMYKYMSKAESFCNKPWFQPSKDCHGYDGPVKTAPHDPAPISKLVLKSFESKGIPFVPDCLATGDVPQACGHASRTIYKGIRTTAADYIAGDRNVEHLTIKTNSYINKVSFVGSGACLEANSVEIQTKDGGKEIIMARKEIILTAGAYGSPAILLRSGIGPSVELQKHGIKQMLESPGVGQNLMDHLVMLNFYEVSEPGLTNDHLIWHGKAKEKSMAEYKEKKTGFFSQFPFGTFAYARLDERLADSPLWRSSHRADGRDPMGLGQGQPNIEIWNTECFSPKYQYKDFPQDDKHVFAMATQFFNARSRGTVTLKSADPMMNPVVDHKYLEDPLDMLLLTEACRFANEIAVDGAGTKGIVRGSWPTSSTHHKFTTREEWEAPVRQRADTCYHPAGSCKMGKDNDPMAVLDAQLRVRGAKRLRVVDASVMPLLMGGHPVMAVYGIAEKAAEMIKTAA